MALLSGGPVGAHAATGTVDTSAKVPLLTRMRGADGHSEYIYLQGVASTIAGSVVTYDEAGVTTLIAANAIGPVAIATAATNSTSEYGWYLICGTQSASCDSGVADNAKVYIDGTAGRVDDTVVTGDQVVGAVFRGTDSSNLVSLQVTYPYVTDSLG